MEGIEKFNAWVDKIAKEMKDKFKIKFYQGYDGWENEELRPNLKRGLTAHIKQAYSNKDVKQWVDCLNYIAFLYHIDNENKEKV